MTRLALALEVWRSELGKPYRWGGDDPIAGWDCSGLVIEGLKACGLFPLNGDDTADGLRRRFPAVELNALKPGDLVFWPDAAGTRATHVEIVYEVIPLVGVYTIGASGGGSATTSEAAAIAQNAYVKVRPERAGVRWAVRPPYHQLATATLG